MGNILQLSKVTESPNNRKYSEVRSREHLLLKEINQMREALKKRSRYPLRDSTLILMMYRHGLRVSEAARLRWGQIELDMGIIHIIRIKKGTPSTHQLSSEEIRALRKLRRDHPYSNYVFNTERKTPIATNTIRDIVKNSGKWAALDFPIHPHMLRHTTGYVLINDKHSLRAIQHYLGHANISNTVRYTLLDANKFDGFLDSL